MSSGGNVDGRSGVGEEAGDKEGKEGQEGYEDSEGSWHREGGEKFRRVEEGRRQDGGVRK